MRILALALLTTITVSGCDNVGSGQTAVLDRLDSMMTEHAAALAGNDVAAMRRTGRAIIATYDAGRGPR